MTLVPREQLSSRRHHVARPRHEHENGFVPAKLLPAPKIKTESPIAHRSPALRGELEHTVKPCDHRIGVSDRIIVETRASFGRRLDIFYRFHG